MIKQARDHLFENVPGLLDHDSSLTTVKRLFNAPNKGYKASARYKGHVNCRIGIKDLNSYDFSVSGYLMNVSGYMFLVIICLFYNVNSIIFEKIIFEKIIFKLFFHKDFVQLYYIFEYNIIL